MSFPQEEKEEQKLMKGSIFLKNAVSSYPYIISLLFKAKVSLCFFPIDEVVLSFLNNFSGVAKSFIKNYQHTTFSKIKLQNVCVNSNFLKRCKINDSLF